MAWKVEFYVDAAGQSPVEEFLEQLPDHHLGKVLQVVQMLEERGPSLPFPYSSQVRGPLRELRIHFGRTLQRILYYGDVRRTFILLHMFEKRTQGLPETDVAVAMKRMEIDQERKRKKQ